MRYIWILNDTKSKTVNVYENEESLNIALVRRYGNQFIEFKNNHNVPNDLKITEYAELIQDCIILKNKIISIK